MKVFIFAVFSLNLFAYGQKVVSVCDRTEQVKEAIVAKLQPVSSSMDCDLANVLLDQIYALNLKKKGIESLKVGDFSGLPSLWWLRLGHNSLSALPVGLFSDLPSLKWLGLDDNKLSVLLVGVFSGLSSLQRLDLARNNLSDLPAGLFSDLPSLEKLYLDVSLVRKADAIRQDVPSGVKVIFRGE